jgi:hypothetical protein
MRVLSSIGFQVMVHFALHFIADLFTFRTAFSSSLTVSRSHEPSFMGKRDDHKRVAIWTERQRMDMLLTEFRIFLFRRNIESSPRTSPQVPGLAFAAIKRCLQSRNHDLLGSLWFVAAGVLTAEMMM